MDFLEATNILKSFSGGDPLPFLMAMSGTFAPLETFLRAAAAKRNRCAFPRALPFNTLPQLLLSEPSAGEHEAFLLLPWDFVPEADWRSGIPSGTISARQLRKQAFTVRARLKNRPNARFFFLPAPLLPLFPDDAEDMALAHWIARLARSLGARFLPREAFSLSSYLLSGCPITGKYMGELAEQVINGLLSSQQACKVLVTDLDNTLWNGVVAEEGLEGIHFSPEGIGYRHFLFQALLARLRREGVLLAAVSRNDPDIAQAPLRSKRMVLGEDDFVCVLASYHSKSAQISEIAHRLNLGFDSFVFIDDNPVELAEVSAQLPEVHCLQFPARDDGLPGIFSTISRLFARSVVTVEDRDRTDLYRRRLAGIPPSDLAGADLTAFLSSLRMRLTIRDRSQGDRGRAVQLINKTNQFNLNGRRLAEKDITKAISAGARLYGASLEDRTGSHGEIMSCLVTPDGVIESWVLSCRVFQRRAEYAFLSWLAKSENPPKALRFSTTQRNLPIQQFLRDPAFQGTDDGLVHMDAQRFTREHASDLSLFTLETSQH